MEEKKIGKVYLVGAGPGDPGLITVKGKALLERAEVVVYDYLANKRFLSHVPPEAELIYVGKKGGGSMPRPRTRSTASWWIRPKPATGWSA